MAMDDCDYYRESHSRRQGMRYDKKNARYRSEDTPWYDPKKYRRERGNGTGSLPDLPSVGWHWWTQLLVVVTLMLASFGLYKLVSDSKARSVETAKSDNSSYTQIQQGDAASQKEAQRNARQLETRRLEDQRVRDLRAPQAVSTEKKEADWTRFFQPSAACRENPATVDCANEYIRARRAFDTRRSTNQ